MSRKLFVYICEEEPVNPVSGTLWVKKNNVTDDFELYMWLVPPKWFENPKPRWSKEQISSLPPYEPLTTIETIIKEIKNKEQLGSLMGGSLRYIAVRSNDEAKAYKDNDSSS